MHSHSVYAISSYLNLMASKSYQLPKSDVPLLSKTDTLPPSRNLIKPFIMISGFILTLLFMVSMVLYYNPTVFHSDPLPPSLSITSLSANPLSNITTETTWNLTLLISNPNPNYDIHFDMIMLAISFNNIHGHLPGNTGFALVPEFDQKRNSEKILSKSLVLFEEKCGKDVKVKNIDVEDEKNESAPLVDVSANVITKYKKDEKKVKMYAFGSKGLNVVFNHKPSNKSVLGFVSDHLPKKLEIVLTGTFDQSLQAKW